MLEVLKFVFSNVWIFIGTAIILYIIGQTLASIIPKIIDSVLSAFQYTDKNILRKAMWDIFSKDIKENEKYNSIEKIEYLYIMLEVMKRLKHGKYEIKNKDEAMEIIEKLNKIL